MIATFNLIDEPWIPCIDLKGEPRLLGLRQILLEAHTIRSLNTESPPEGVAVTRLLLAILHATYRGPAEVGDWSLTWQTGAWDEKIVGGYLDKRKDRFDLFDKQYPFLQAADERVKPKSIAALRHEFASGNNATLFDHTLDDQPPELSPAEAARSLLTAMSFGLAGLSGFAEKFTSATCAGGVIFLAQGDNLFETLALNWVRYDEDSPIPIVGKDRAAWETDDPWRPLRTRPLGYLDYLTWPNRRILLFPKVVNGRTVVSEVTVAPGLRLDRQNDPMKRWMPNRDPSKGLVPLRFNETKALWRDSAAILDIAEGTGETPACIKWIATLIENSALDRSRREQIIGAGMASDQAKVLFYRFDRLPLPLIYLSEEGSQSLGDLHNAIGRAENVGKQLWGATRRLASELLVSTTDKKNGEETREPRAEDIDQVSRPLQVEQRYWSRLDDRFMSLMQDLPMHREEAMRTWNDHLYDAAIAAFESVGLPASTQSKGYRAWVVARDQLGAGLRIVLPPNIRSPRSQRTLDESNEQEVTENA